MNHPYRYLLRKTAIWLRQSAGFLWVFVVVAYMTVLGGHSVYRSYQSQQETKALRTQLEEAVIEKDRLQALLVYYGTDSYKEKELRRALLLKRPEETAYALPESSTVISVEDAIAQKSAASAKQAVHTEPIWQQWLNYVWNGEKA